MRYDELTEKSNFEWQHGTFPLPQDGAGFTSDDDDDDDDRRRKRSRRDRQEKGAPQRRRTAAKDDEFIDDDITDDEEMHRSSGIFSKLKNKLTNIFDGDGDDNFK